MRAESCAFRIAAVAAVVLLGVACGTTPPASPGGGGAPTDVQQPADGAIDGAPADGAPGDTTGVGDAALDTATPGDTTDPDEAVTPGDTTVLPGCPGAAGCACAADADCTGGACVAGKDGKSACLTPCDADGKCAAGQVCAEAKGKKGCVAADLLLCNPCNANAECQVPGGPAGAACVTGSQGGGNFCGAACTGDTDCATGYACLDGTDVEGKTSKQCRPKDAAACACSGLANLLKLTTICGTGACAGKRQCLAKGEPGAPADGGLTACDGAAAGAETCNGKDDDCDGKVDGDASCDDKNPCTVDKCGGAAGCTNTPAAGPCDDGSACTENDACKDDKCVGTAVACDDKNPCTDDSCDLAKGCTAVADDTNTCADTDVCTTEACVAGACASAAVVCDDKNACTDDSCDLAKGCTSVADDTNACDDNSQCTKDACKAGACGVVSKVVCDDNNPCTPDSCDPKSGCVSLAADASVTCNDDNACTTDTCDAKTGCLYKPVPGCAIALPYKQAFHCNDAAFAATWVLDVPAAATPSWAVDGLPNPPGFVSAACSLNFNNGKDFLCPPGASDIPAQSATSPMFDATALKKDGPLTVRFQLAGGWEGLSYDDLKLEASTDGKAWILIKDYDAPSGWAQVTESLKAFAGTKFQLRFRFLTTDCIGNSGVGAFIDDLEVFDASCAKDADCNDNNACTDDACDLATKLCVLKANTLPCDDKNVCTEADVCALGKCVGKNNTLPCDDGIVCTIGDTCSGGKCSNTKPKCDDANPCTKDACDAVTGACTAPAAVDSSNCSDGNTCTTGDTCYGGKCIAKAKCVDGNPCTTDTCSSTGTCTYPALPDAATCTDGDPCTKDDLCGKGVCTPGAAAPCSVLVTDQFACADAGTWAIAPLPAAATAWAIDASPVVPAFKSPSCSLNFNNGTDFQCAPSSPSGTKVAGTATSAAYDLGAAKAAQLSFESWGAISTGDTTDFRWVEISADDFATPPMQVWVDNDSGTNGKWQTVKIDLGAFAGKKIKVRFHFDSGDCVTNSGAGWFVDDLTITTDVAKGCSGDASCEDGNACTKNTCGADGKCQLSYTTDPCEDGSKCTEADLCDGKGACKAGKAVTCDDLNSCTTNTCEPATGCKYKDMADGASCNDSDPCTLTDKCTAAKCAGDPKGACVDNNPCTTDACEKTSPTVKKCVYTPIKDGDACEDGDACTGADVCSGGSCKGAPVCSATYSETFECGKPGTWTLDAPVAGLGWKVDALPNPPAPKSPGCTLNFNNDKDFVCPTGTSAVAPASAVSPLFDATGLKAGDALVFKFWFIGAFENGTWDEMLLEASLDGKVWTVIKNYDPVSTWTQKSEDLAAYIGKKFQLRFRFFTTDCTANGGFGAFVDDLTLLTSGCTADAQCGDDGNVCTTAKCVQNKCATVPATGLCDDGDACTQDTACKDGKCAGVALNCDDANPCTADSCDKAKGCVHAVDPACAVALPFEKDFACNAKDNGLWVISTAEAGGPGWAFDATPAVPGFKSADCSLNFNNGKDFACAKGSKVEGTATSPPLDGTKLGANASVEARFQLAGDWEDGTYDNLVLEVSTDGGQTWVLADDPVGGDKITKKSSYDAPDNLKFAPRIADLSKLVVGKKFLIRFRFFTTDCTQNGGVGAFIDDLKVYDATCKADGDCNDDQPCTDGKCDVATGKCSHAANTKACDDGNPCTTGDVCATGTCTAKVVVCNDNNDCTTDACDAKTGACAYVAKADAAFCSDGQTCTDEACLGGKCVAKNKADGATCTDNNVCTGSNAFVASDACLAGKCVPGGNACEDGSPCTTETCTGTFSKSCKTTATDPDGTVCSDGKNCTVGDVCASGKCAGGQDKCTFVDFKTEDFEKCAQTPGWTLDAAVSGVGWAFDGTPDPPKAHAGLCSANFNDGKIYGIPGKASAGAAVSPAFDIPEGAVAVTLSFWSYSGLQAGENSYDKRKVEVLSGGAVIATLPVATATDIGKWVELKLVFNAPASKKVQFRFHFDTVDSISNNGPGWFVDDLKLAGGSTASAPAGKTWSVKTANFAFDPKDLTIAVGDSVEFALESFHAAREVDKATWEANGSSAKAGGFYVDFGKTEAVKFDKAGDYYYVCPPHAGGGMKGLITVK